MSFANPEELAAHLGGDALLPMVTPEAVRTALHDFSLSLLPGKDWEWLALAVRRTLAIGLKHVSGKAERPSNRQVRQELARLSQAAQSAWVTIFSRSREADSELWSHAFRSWQGSNALAAAEDADFGYNRFMAAVVELEWLSSILRDAARSTPKQRGSWRSAEMRQERIDRGQSLAAVFVAAFGQQPTANNFSGAKWSGDAISKAPTAFMDFYQRMVGLAFSERATPDLSGVTKEACRLHRKDPASFSDWIVPGL